MGVIYIYKNDHCDFEEVSESELSAKPILKTLSLTQGIFLFCKFEKKAGHGTLEILPKAHSASYSSSAQPSIVT